jgi:hypothetical protein
MELAAAAAADAVKRLQGGESWDAVAKSLDQAVVPPKFVARSDQQVPLEVRTTAFGESKPAGKPIYAEARLANGDATVIALSAVREEPADPSHPDLDMGRQYAAQIASVEAQSYAVGARADAKVTLNPQALD